MCLSSIPVDTVANLHHEEALWLICCKFIVHLFGVNLLLKRFVDTFAKSIPHRTFVDTAANSMP